MKVAFVTIDYPPLMGGLAAHVKGVVDLAEQLGYQTEVVTVKFNPSIRVEGKLDNNVIQLLVLSWFRDSPIINPFKLYRVLTDINANIIHVIYPFPVGLDVSCFYAHLNHKKLVCTYIDDIIVKFPYSLLINLYEHTFWKICKKMINSVSVSTEEYGKSSVGLRDWKVGFFQIPPPVFDCDYNLTLGQKTTAREKLELIRYEKVVLFVGALRKRTTYKRLDLLLKAWSEYVKQNDGDNAVLLIVGDGELNAYYRSLAKQFGLTENNVIFKGFVSRAVLEDCYLAGDILVLPSEDNNEAFGIVAIEAMLYGNIVIGTDIPGIRGAVRQGKGCCVSLIPPKRWEPLLDELKIWTTRDLRECVLENHRFVKNNYNNDIVKRQLAGMYNA